MRIEKKWRNQLKSTFCARVHNLVKTSQKKYAIKEINPRVLFGSASHSYETKNLTKRGKFQVSLELQVSKFKSSELENQVTDLRERGYSTSPSVPSRRNYPWKHFLVVADQIKIIYLYQLVQTLLQAVPQRGVSVELVAHLPVAARSFYSVLLPAASFFGCLNQPPSWIWPYMV